MSLKKAINKYCRDQNNGVQEMLEKLRSYQPVWKPEIKEELKAIVKNIEKLKEESEKGLLLIDNLLGDVDGEESKILINKIGEVNKNIIKLIDSIIFSKQRYIIFMIWPVLILKQTMRKSAIW